MNVSGVQYNYEQQNSLMHPFPVTYDTATNVITYRQWLLGIITAACCTCNPYASPETVKLAVKIVDAIIEQADILSKQKTKYNASTSNSNSNSESDSNNA